MKLPVLGKDKEVTEEYKERYKAVKEKLDEVRLELLKEKDFPLNQRKGMVFRAPIDLLVTHPYIKRHHSREFIEDLKKDIERVGMLEKPICTLDFGLQKLQMAVNNILFTDASLFIYVVAGNARIQAAKELGYASVDVIIKYLTSDEVFQVALSDNDKRDELNPIDRALWFKNWIEKTGISTYKIAEKQNKSQGWVWQHIRLLKLPKKVQELIREGKVTFLQAQKILQIDDPEVQTKLAELCAEGISTKELEAKIQKAKLKLIPINAFIPPAPNKTDIKPDIPPRPVSPPKPLPKPPKPLPKPSPNEAEIAVQNIRKAIESSIKLIEGKEGKFGKLFPLMITGLELMIEHCNGDCEHCKYANVCMDFLKLLQNIGIKFPELAG